VYLDKEVDVMGRFQHFRLGGDFFAGTVLAAAGGDDRAAGDTAQQAEYPLVCKTGQTHKDSP
jgi:hypothetical protein